MALAIVAEGNAACKIAYCRACFAVFTANQGRGRPRKRCIDCQRAHARTTPKVYKYKYRPNRIKKPLAKQYICQQCQVGFHPMGTDRTQFCSRHCAQEHRAIWGTKQRKARWPHSKVCFPTCQECKALFVSRRFGRKYCSDNCSKKATLRNIFEAAARAKGQEPRICMQCQSPFTPIYGDRRRSFCSKACKIKAVRRVRKPIERARKKAATVEPVDPFKVFDRDGWRCQICHKPTPRRLRGSLNDNAPELDHIVPLARGGEHSYRNTQCACRKCNSRKSDSIYGQLHLFVA